MAKVTPGAAGQPSLPFLNKFLYSFGSVGIALANQVMLGFVIYFYAPTEGKKGAVPLLSPLVVGAIFLIGRVLDSFIDPSVAYFSDRCKSPRGRRIPFMLWGGLPLAATMALLFFPPVRNMPDVYPAWSPDGMTFFPPVHGMSPWNAVYLAFMLSSFYFFFSFYVCPYLGLLPELARTARDRTNLSSAQGGFTLLGTAIASIAGAIIISKAGFGGMGLAMGALAFIFFYAPVIAVDEKKYCIPAPHSELSIIDTIKSTLESKPFVIYLIGNLSFWFGFNIVTSCVLYYVTALLGLKEEAAEIYFALALGVSFVFIILFMVVFNALKLRISNRIIMIGALAMFMALLPLIYFMGMPGTPLGTLTFSYILISLIGIPLSVLFIIPNAIVADLTDYDEKLTGLRREAIYFGTQGFFLKTIQGVSTLTMGILFHFFGKSVDHPLGVRLTGVVGGFFALVGLIAFLYFPKDLNAHAAEVLADRKSRKLA